MDGQRPLELREGGHLAVYVAVTGEHQYGGRFGFAGQGRHPYEIHGPPASGGGFGLRETDPSLGLLSPLDGDRRERGSPVPRVSFLVVFGFGAPRHTGRGRTLISLVPHL